ncbi:MAG: hypothetical protein GEV04_14865 [Actinophytocola sp.]|nr:hypothetical protein [Actinophytocola sp.]
MSAPTQPAPKPDSVTGQPRPPQAPVEASWKPYDKATDIDPDDPPPGKGPALEWFADAKRTMWGAAGFLFLLGVIFLSVKDGGIDWMGVWWLWLILVVFTSPLLLVRRGTRMTVGADWLRLAGDQWVDTYRLSTIRVTTGFGTYHLELTDAAGNKADTQVWYLQKNRKLWDLLYNGILHSIVHHGADVNRRAVEHLHLQAVIRKPPIT